VWAIPTDRMRCLGAEDRVAMRFRTHPTDSISFIHRCNAMRRSSAIGPSNSGIPSHVHVTDNLNVFRFILTRERFQR
jgi:hypothetical protein